MPLLTTNITYEEVSADGYRIYTTINSEVSREK